MSPPSKQHEYRDSFFAYINAGSTSSANVVCPLLVGWLHPSSLLDVGCGAGAWCRVWGERGVNEVVGVDGDYLRTESLLIPASSFRRHDLSIEFDLGTKFDLVTSLEVAEHIPETSAGLFVANLARHGDAVLFSAAIPGQGGEFHVNEQPLEYWRQRFAALGFRCFDPLRPALVGRREVEPWYRYNTLLFLRGAAADRALPAVLASEVKTGEPIAEVAPLSWRARNAVIRRLPRAVSDSLVQLKHAWVRRLNRA